MTYLKIARCVATFMLLAFVFYGGGQTLALEWVNNAAEIDNRSLMPVSVGVAMMLVNSLMVAGIGVLMRPVLQQSSERIAMGYLWCRLIEAGLLAISASVFIVMIAALNNGTSIAALLVVQNKLYHLAIFSLAAGSLPMCRLLLRKVLVPKWIALAGIVGYSVLLAGSFLALFSFDLGLLINLPGMVFELAFPIAIAWKGFRPYSLKTTSKNALA